MKRILTSKAYALIACSLIAAAVGVGSSIAATTEPKEAKLTELMSKDLTNLPGKEGLMLLIEYPPGSTDQYIGITRMGLFMSWKARS